MFVLPKRHLWFATVAAVGLLLPQAASARVVDPQFLGLFAKKCDKAVYVSTGSSQITVVSSTTVFALMAYPHAQLVESYDRLGSWSLGTTNKMEFCYDPVLQNSGVFKISVSFSHLQSQLNNVTYAWGKHAGVGVQNGDEVDPPIVVMHPITHLTEVGVATVQTLSDGDCVGLMAVASASTNVFLRGMIVEFEQLDCRDED